MANLIIEWNEVLLEAIRQTKPGPPMVARSIAIVHTSIYDAWAAYDPVANQTRTDFNAGAPNTPENIATSISFAAYRSLFDQFSAVTSLFDEKMTQLGLDIGQTSNNPATPWGVGNKASKNVLNFRQNDGANEAGIMRTPQVTCRQTIPSGPFSPQRSRKSKMRINGNP